jgi:acyl-CoA-dependent ceramide synthase
MFDLAEHWLHPALAPFFSLSHKTDTPLEPDSFPNSVYYNTGPKDLCLLIGCIAVMAVLRDALRLGVFEPFARWKLTRDLGFKRASRLNGNGKANGNGTTNGNAHGNGATNGNANGNGHAHSSNMSKRELRQMHRSVLRFAEQGWPAVYYPIQWAFGLVGPIVFLTCSPRSPRIFFSMSTITFQPECLSLRTCG